MIATGQGSVDCLKVLLKHDVPIDVQTFGSGSTALHWAIDGSSSECVLALLKAGARVDIKSETGESRHRAALLHAAVKGMWDIAEILIKHGVPTSTLKISGGTSVIHEASTAGEERILRLILDLPERPDLNTKNQDRYTPLELAAAKGDTACFQLLLDNGAFIDTGIELNGGIAHASTSPISNDIRKLLLHRDIRWNVPSLMNCNNINYMDVLPLHRAAYYGNDTCIQFLKQNGLIEDIDVLAEYSMTALHFAACCNQQETVKLLLQLGANPEIVETRYKRTPLISAARYGAASVVTTLLDHGCKAAATDMNGWTAYINAIQQSFTDISKLLKMHEYRANGTPGKLDLPATPARGVSFADELLFARSTQRFSRENQDMTQQLRDEMSEIKRLLLKPELALAADQPNTTNVQTNTTAQHLLCDSSAATGKIVDQAKTEAGTNIEVVIGRTFHSRAWGIMSNQNNLVFAMMIGVAMLLFWVVKLLDGVNKTLMDLRN